MKKLPKEQKLTSTRHELAQFVTDQTGLPYVQSYEVLQLFLDKLIDNLLATNHLELRGFGIFEIIERKGRIGRNPKKPENTVWIPDRKTIRFRPSVLLKKRLGAKKAD